MINTRRFCAACGITDTPLHEYFCRNCFWINTRMAKPSMKRIDINYCLECFALKLPSGWSGQNSRKEIGNIIAHSFNKMLNLAESTVIENFTPVEIKWIHPNPEFSILYHLSNSSIPVFEIHREDHMLHYKLQKGICKVCVQKKTGSGEILVQFRVNNRSISSWEQNYATKIAIELTSIHSYESPNSYLSDINENHGGLDFYFGNSLIAESFIEKLKEKWIGHFEKNFKLVTEDKQKKKVYRVTYLYRIPEVVRGDLIEYNEELYYASKVTKSGVHIQSLLDHTRIIVKEWKTLIPANPAPFPVRKLVLSEDQRNTSYQIMDLGDYTTIEIEMKRFQKGLPVGQEVTLLLWNDKFYYNQFHQK